MLTEDFFKDYLKALAKMHGSLSWMRTSEAIIEAAAQLFKAQGASLMLYDHGSKTLKSSAASGLSRQFLEKGPVAPDRSLRETVELKPVIIADTSKEAQRLQYKEEVAREGIRSIIGMPIKPGNLLVGTLRLYFSQAREPDPIEIIALEGLAKQAGLALKKSVYFTTFTNVVRSIHKMPSLTSLDSILLNLVQNAAAGGYAKGCALWLWNEKAKAMELASGIGLSKRYLNQGPLTKNKSLVEVETGRPLVIARVEGDDRVQYPQQTAEENVKAIIGFPIRVAQKIVGALRFYFEYEFGPDDDDLAYMGLLSRQVEAALEKNQYLIRLKADRNGANGQAEPENAPSDE